VQIPAIDGPAPYEEIDFTPEYHQVEQQPDVNFETSRTDVEPIPVAHKKIDTSHATKKEMMHMINVFTSPDQQKDEATKTNEKDKGDTSRTLALDNTTTTDGSSNLQQTTATNKDTKVTISDEANGNDDDPTPIDKTKACSPEEYSTMTTCLSDNADDEEDNASPYADLVDHLQKISLKSDQDVDLKLRERHAQLVDLLWRAAMRSTSSKRTQPLPASVSTTATPPPISSIASPSSLSSSSSSTSSSPSSIPFSSTKSTLSSRSPLATHSITV
jgi:hypothetical protein